MELLERVSQLQALNSALSQVKARNAQGCVALVYGEAGIGKTLLIEHFINEHKSSLRILRGACDSLITPRPLSPVHDIALQTQGSLFAALKSESHREAIFSSCLNELKAQATILTIEDVHWADDATLDLLKYLGRRMNQTTSLMILTYRDDEINRDHPLMILLGDLATSHSLHRIPVSPLSESAVHELTKDKNVDSRELHRLTNGNPFFVTEVLAAESGIPETVRDAVLARAARLSSAARNVLEATAVIGARVEPWLLSNIVGKESVYVEECLSKGILQTQGDYYAFRHELARQIIFESVSLQKRIALHRMILNSLKKSPKTRGHLAQLAHHAEGTQDAHAVIEYAPAAAKQASAASSHREAVAQYARALRYADILPKEQRAQLFENQSYELWLNGRVEESVKAQDDALTLWRQLDRQDKAGNCLRFLSQITFFAGKIVEAKNYIAQALETLEKLPPGPELANVYSTKARIHMILWEEDQALHWGTRAIELAETLGDTEILITALNTVGNVEQDSQPEIGQLKLLRSLKLALEYKLHEDVVRAYGNLGRGEYYHRRYESALNYNTDGMQYAEKHDLELLLFATKSERARVYFEQGRWMEAITEASEALNSNRIYLMVQADALDVLSRIQVRQGNPVSQETLDFLRKFANDNPVGEGFRISALFAEIAWLEDDLNKCRTEAEPMFQIVCQLNSKRDIGELAYWLWRADAITESPVNADEPYAAQIAGDWKAAASMWENFGCPYEQGMALMDGDEAAQLAALEIFERLGARPIMHKLKQKMHAEGIRIPHRFKASVHENPGNLTAREIEILRWVSQGLSNQEIADRLVISRRTVHAHLRSIYEKLGVTTRTAAVHEASQFNLL